MLSNLLEFLKRNVILTILTWDQLKFTFWHGIFSLRNLIKIIMQKKVLWDIYEIVFNLGLERAFALEYNAPYYSVMHVCNNQSYEYSISKCHHLWGWEPPTQIQLLLTDVTGKHAGADCLPHTCGQNWSEKQQISVHKLVWNILQKANLLAFIF